MHRIVLRVLVLGSVVLSACSANPAATPETDPVFGKSPAATATATDVEHWNQAYAWGNHADAGYLTKESEPAFAAAPSAGITAAQIADWNAAYSWGNHATAGYTPGALDGGSVPVWNGNALVDGAIVQNASGQVGIGTSVPDATLSVGTVARFGAPAVRSVQPCNLPTASDWTDVRSSQAACAAYCQGVAGPEATGQVVADGTRSCNSSFCDYISDFASCTVSQFRNTGQCDTCSSTFTCQCSTPSNVVSDLHVADGGYVQLDTASGSPDAADCSNSFQRGRMRVDPQAGTLWVCMNSGWVAK